MIDRILVAGLVSAALVFLVACNFVESSGGPLTEEECGQLMDQFHEVLGADLEGKDLEEWNADRDREADVAECVSEQKWNRAAFDCAMEQTTHDGLNRCLVTSR